MLHYNAGADSENPGIGELLMKRLLLATLLATAPMALASNPYNADSAHPACQGDPKCIVVDEDTPILGGRNGVYVDSGYIYMSRQKVERHPECAAKIHRHEQTHRRQHQQGRDFASPDAEREARDAVPDMYNCASRGPNGSLGNYQRPGAFGW